MARISLALNSVYRGWMFRASKFEAALAWVLRRIYHTYAIGGLAAWCRLSLVTKVLVCLVFLAATIVANTMSGPLFSFGNLHDIFIPLNAAIALEQGLTPHTDIRSPLGPFYFYISWVSFHISNDKSSIVFLSNVLFLAIFTINFILIALTRKRFDIALALFFSIIILAPREFGGNAAFITWYGNYNRHCIALFLTCLLLVFDGTKNDKSSYIVYCIFVLDGLFLFTYKISFAASIFFLQLAYFVKNGSLLRAAPAILVGLAAAALALLDDTVLRMLLAYLSDIVVSVSAKSSEAATWTFPSGHFFLFVVAYFAIDQVLVRRIPNLRYLTEYFFVCVSVFFAVMGVYRMPPEVLWIVLGVKLFVSAGQSGPNMDWSKTRFALPVFCAFLILGTTFTKDAISLIVTGLSRSGVTVLPAMEQSVIDLNLHEGSTFRIEVVGRTIGTSQQKILPFKRDTHLNASVTSGVTLAGPALSPEDRVIYESAYNDPRTLGPSNFEYLWGFREAQRIYEKGVLPAGTVIFTPDFTNPFPALLGSPMLKNSFLWLHAGTTISPDDVDLITPSYEGADLVLIPAAPTSRYSQPAISRSLLTFNKQFNGKFCLIGVSVLWLHYLRCDMASEIMENGLTRSALLRERISAARTLSAAALLAE